MFHRPRPRVPIGAPYSCFGPGDSRLQAGPAPAGCANSHAAPDHLPRRWRLPKLSEGRRARSPLRVAPHSSSCHSATRTIPAAYTMRIAILDGADDETQRPRLCRFSRLAARFSSNDLAGFFLPSFFRSMPLLMSFPSHGTVIADSILASRSGLNASGWPPEVVDGVRTLGCRRIPIPCVAGDGSRPKSERLG